MDIIIIGAGATGLMAAKQLSAAGLKVTVLEARERTGGRIFSFSKQPYDFTVEGGAEFIHGNLAVTLKLLGEAGLQKQELAEGVWQVTKGQWKQKNDFFERAEAVIAKLKELTEDISMAAFMERFFAADEYEKLRIALVSYIEGYYSAEVSNISALSFLEEWMSEDEQQYRPVGGYGKMIDYLADSSKKCGAGIQLSTVVKEIKWCAGRVDVTDETGRVYTAQKAVITVPLGVWTAEESAKGAISYIPALPAKMKAATQMGFGAVIKVLLYFKEPFWHDQEVEKSTNADTRSFHMAISDMTVPTWWTQVPNELSLLTGWLSGPKAEQMKNGDDETILQDAFTSISSIFNINPDSLQQKLQWSQIFNWTIDPFTRGSYSYSTLHTAKARSVLLEPEKDTLFFAGEALYDGPEMGTVEAALISGMEVASKIIELLQSV